MADAPGRTVGRAGTVGVDKLAKRMGARRRQIDGAAITVGELAATGPLLERPRLPYPGEVDAARTVTAQALVPFAGNFYSVPPGLVGLRVHVRHRLGEDHLDIATAGRAVIARHRIAPRGSGRTVRDAGHVVALKQAALAAFSDRAALQGQDPPAAVGRRRGGGRQAADRTREGRTPSGW